MNGGTLQAPGGRIEVAGVIGQETVQINSDGSLSLPATNRSDIYFADRTRIDVRRENGGSIGIHARNLEISGGSILSAGIAENLGITGDRAGNIEIDAEERVAISGASPTGFFSVVSNQVGTKGTGNGGNINIQVGSLSVTNGAILNTSSFGNGNAGNIMIQARDRVLFAGQRPFNEMNTDRFSSGAFARSQTGAVGNSGSINIVAQSLNVSNGGVLTNSVLGMGNAGNITIQSRDAVVFDGEGDNVFSSGAFSRIRGGARGEEGSINIATRSLFVGNGALISTSTNGEGNGGSILINSTDSVTVSGFGIFDNFSSGLFTQAEPGAFGRGGTITVNTNTLRVQNGAVINAETVRDTNGCSIAINVRTFEATNGGQVFTTTRGRGNAGDITINATDSIALSGSDRTFAARVKSGRDNVPNQGAASGLYANTFEDSTGAGGNLNVRTDQLIVRDGAKVTVSADGKGAAGNLRVAADSIRLNNGTIAATTQAGNFGNITLQTGNLQMRRNSQITTNASGTATGGNINIEAGAVAALENSDIRANAVRGRGGNIIITAEGIFQSLDSDIDASSELGIDGNVELRTPDTDPVKGLNQPEILGVPPAPAQTCQTGSQRTSRFVITGRGGLPPSPRERVSSEHNFEAVKEPIVEAQGWIINAKGEIELVANSAAVVPYSPGRAPVCN